MKHGQIKHKSDFFPREVFPAWLAAFSSLVDYGELIQDLSFEILQEDFELCAAASGQTFKKHEDFAANKKPIDLLGQHLFTYYLWDMYPLKGERKFT